MAATSELQRLAALFEGHPDVRTGQMFGSPCLKIRGKVFATQHDGLMVFKLPPGAHATALALAGAARWNPSGRRVLREWVAVPTEHHQSVHDLAQAAAQFVGGKNDEP